MLESTIMSTSLILDVSFGLLALLFLPIGYRRGVQREVFVTAGVLAGAQLSASWARPWGSDVADAIDVRTGIGAFAVSAAFIVGAAVVLGYGGSGAANPRDPGRWGRAVGALLAVANGTLVAAYLLRDIERFLADAATERALARSRVADVLLRQFGWVVVGMAALGALAVAVVLLRRRDSAVTLAPAVSAAWDPPPLATSPRKPRLGWGTDEGKVEPARRAFDSASGRFAADAPSLHATMPMAPVAPPPDRAGNWRGDRSEWMEIAPRDPNGWAPRAADPPVPTGPRCAGCGEALTPEDMFCPRCGRARPMGEWKA